MHAKPRDARRRRPWASVSQNRLICRQVAFQTQLETPSCGPGPTPSSSALTTSPLANNLASTWRVVRDVLHKDHRPVYSDSQFRTLASGFSQYFTDSWNAFTSRSPPACSQPLNPTFVDACTPARRCHSCRPPLLTTTCLKPSPIDVLPTSLLR